MSLPMTTPKVINRSRREEILELAVELFAARGYHGVSMDDIGARAHITGPALYHHFKGGKEEMLAEALIPVSARLLAGGREHTAAHADDPRAALRALVTFHVDFALTSPAVIAVQLHELDRLPSEPRHRIRKLQRSYVEEWVGVLRRLRPELGDTDARVLAHAAFGLMNSTPFLGRDSLAERPRIAELLTEAALSALDPEHRSTP
ncbi:transcriptional regulator, TetR family [Stackebrandtia nassauensis DSM 44728]|uniref:Transcriptional regulator, TetR family n=2 Tax=Stackebrandtia TaxID=283810 RepID=D3Q1J5_STANL|nr:transcriptional regulator, TetR family [Stackebrandtia nassauensis DSM 44728]